MDLELKAKRGFEVGEPLEEFVEPGPLARLLAEDDLAQDQVEDRLGVLPQRGVLAPGTSRPGPARPASSAGAGLLAAPRAGRAQSSSGSSSPSSCATRSTARVSFLRRASGLPPRSAAISAQSRFRAR